MIQTLRTRIAESEHPVGVKKTSNWKLPPVDFVYGKKNKEDKEGASIITRSWQVHAPSKTAVPPQDFIQINKVAVKMNATSHALNKDFRKTVDIKKKLPRGSNERRIYLPSEDFVYGRRNRTPTPVKDVINYNYANKAEEVIKMEYAAFIDEKKRLEKLEPKTTKAFNRLLQTKKESMKKKEEDKPLYKMRMFRDVNSKVKQNLKNFKTYDQKQEGNIDRLIDQVESELRQDE